MNDHIIGKCSLCGGDVVLPVVWSGIVPPTPRCRMCWAEAASPCVPVIPMQQRK